MKAAQWDSIVINDVPIPEPQDGQFRIKMRSASLCHSDLMTVYRPPSDTPTTIGHEGVGYIDKITPSVEGKGFEIGDAVGFLYLQGCCHECEGCSVHNYQCQKGKAQIVGFQVDGYFAEYALVDWQNVIKLPSNLDLTRSAPIFCAGVTAFHAVDSCELQPDQWLAVIGCGGLGQFAIQYAKAMNVKVLAVDIHDETLQVAAELGADITYNSQSQTSSTSLPSSPTTETTTIDTLKTQTKTGVHAAAVFTDAPQAYALAPSLLRINGLLMVVGLTTQPIPISTHDLIVGSYRIKAESIGTTRRLPKAIEFIAKHQILPRVEFRGLEELPEMMREMESGRAMKRMVVLF